MPCPAAWTEYCPRQNYVDLDKPDFVSDKKYFVWANGRGIRLKSVPRAATEFIWQLQIEKSFIDVLLMDICI